MDRLVDSRGRACPIPVIDLAREMAAADIDDVVVLLADDPAARVDIPAWCRMRAQELAAVEERADHTLYRVRRIS